jgi:hypothetical protein
MINLPKDKPIRLKTDKWQELKNLADELSADLGISVSLPDAIGHLLKFYREHSDSKV